MTAPVFVGGDDRSGTTLVCLILDSHPDIVVGPELEFVTPPSLGEYVVECCELLVRGDPRADGPGVESSDPRYLLGVQFVLQCHRFGIEPARVGALARETMREVGGDLVRFEDRCALIDRIGELRRAEVGKPRWGIKILRHIARADSFVRVWPDARFVSVVRDGRDVAASHLRGNRGWGYTDAAEAAAGWSEVVLAAESCAAPVYTLRYEDLVARPAETLKSLVRWLGLSWNDALLHHEQHAHALLVNPYEHPSADAAARPVNDLAVGRYRNDLTPAEIAAFEAVAGPTLVRMGYRLEGAEIPTRLRALSRKS